MNPYGISEITAAELVEKLTDGDEFFLVDVREAPELLRANLGQQVIHMPLSDLAQRYFEAIPDALSLEKEREIVFFCHHGIRSAQVCAFFKANGWTNVLNLAGGIDAYARNVDPAIGLY